MENKSYTRDKFGRFASKVSKPVTHNYKVGDIVEQGGNFNGRIFQVLEILQAPHHYNAKVVKLCNKDYEMLGCIRTAVLWLNNSKFLFNKRDLN